MSTAGDFATAAGLFLGAGLSAFVGNRRASKKSSVDVAQAAAEGAGNALNGTASRVQQLVGLVEGHIATTAENFQEIRRTAGEASERTARIEGRMDQHESLFERMDDTLQRLAPPPPKPKRGRR